MTHKITDIFYPQFKDATQNIFGDNLLFAFIFGSFAKGYGDQLHDIDTFVCVREKDAAAIKQYVDWLTDQHNSLGATLDVDYPAEIVDLSDLNGMLIELPEIQLKLADNPARVFDHVVWAQVLSEDQKFIVGDELIVQHYREKCALYPEKWKEQVVSALRKVGDEREHICQERDALYILRKIVGFNYTGNGLCAPSFPDNPDSKLRVRSAEKLEL